METSTGDPHTLAPRSWKHYLSWESVRTIFYWFCTLLVAFEMMVGGVWDLLRIEYVRVVLAHLGYPMYLLTILGVWKIPCALVLLVPRFPRFKEWAYAGAFFTYSGAIASHFFTGDGADLLVPPFVLAVLTLASWALRPAQRRFAPAAAPTKESEVGALAWAVPILIAVVFLILSFLTLPAGPPPALGGSETLFQPRPALAFTRIVPSVR